MFQSVPYKRNSYKKGTLVPETVLKDDGLKFISAKQGFPRAILFHDTKVSLFVPGLSVISVECIQSCKSEQTK